MINIQKKRQLYIPAYSLHFSCPKYSQKVNNIITALLAGMFTWRISSPAPTLTPVRHTQRV